MILLSCVCTYFCNQFGTDWNRDFLVLFWLVCHETSTILFSFSLSHLCWVRTIITRSRDSLGLLSYKASYIFVMPCVRLHLPNCQVCFRAVYSTPSHVIGNSSCNGTLPRMDSSAQNCRGWPFLVPQFVCMKDLRDHSPVPALQLRGNWSITRHILVYILMCLAIRKAGSEHAA